MLRFLLCALALYAASCSDREPVPSPDPHAPGEPAAPATPQAAEVLQLVLVANLSGVLEPCGCGGRPLGGLDRVAGTVAELRSETTPSALLAVGDLLYERDAREPLQPQEALEADAMSALVAALRPDALAPGPTDLRLGGARLTGLQRASRAPLLRADGPPIDALEGAVPRTTLAVGGRRIGLIANRDHAAPEELARTIAQLREAGAHAVVRIEHARQDQPAAGLAVVDDADVVITAGSAREGATLEHGTLVVAPGWHGESLWVIELRFPTEHASNARAHSQARRVELGERAAVDRAARTLLDQTFARIHALNADRGAAMREDAEEPLAASFVGSRTCAACHTSAYLWWQSTPHGRAFATLEARGRALDLDCIGCHVTGFDAPGGARIGRLEELKGVGCESCHGPSGPHADNPRAARSTRREVPAATCVACHDAEHDPGFDYGVARGQLLSPAHGHVRTPRAKSR